MDGCMYVWMDGWMFGVKFRHFVTPPKRASRWSETVRSEPILAPSCGGVLHLVSRFQFDPRLVRISVSMLRFCLSTYVLMSVKRLVFVYVCEGFSYLCVFVKIDCVFVFGLMYLCM